MESYIEVSFIHNVMIIVLSQMMAGYLSLRPIPLKKQLLYACSISFYGVVSWFINAWIGMILVDLFFLFLFYRYTLKTYLFALSFRILWYLTCIVCLEGSFHNGMYFPSIYSSILMFWVVLILLFLLLYQKWNVYMIQSSFVYSCTIKKGNNDKKMKGYLDTGNLLIYESYPVIFMDKKYQSLFLDTTIKSIEMETMQSQSKIEVCEASIQLEYQKEQKVFICFKDQFYLPFHCELLLNIELLSKGGS